MKNLERGWLESRSRRKALATLGGMLAASPLLRAQLDPYPLSEHRRVLGLDEMMTAFDFEPVFKANVPQATYDFTAPSSPATFGLADSIR